MTATTGSWSPHSADKNTVLLPTPHHPPTNGNDGLTQGLEGRFGEQQEDRLDLTEQPLLSDQQSLGFTDVGILHKHYGRGPWLHSIPMLRKISEASRVGLAASVGSPRAQVAGVPSIYDGKTKRCALLDLGSMAACALR
ncbi:MAG: hypothetical protein ABIQ30_10375 [Devosia sp.]